MMQSYLIYLLIDSCLDVIGRNMEFKMKLDTDLVVGREFKILCCTIWLGEEKKMCVVNGKICQIYDNEVWVVGKTVIAGDYHWCIDPTKITSVNWK